MINLLFWSITQLIAQNTQLDSLGAILDKTQKNSIDKVRTLVVMSRSLQKKSPERALIYAQQALLLGERLNYQRGISDALYFIANSYGELDNHSKSLEYYIRALKFYQSTSNLQGQAISFKNIGNIYFEYGDYPQSLNTHLEALKVYEKLKDQAGVATSLTYIGDVYTISQDFDRALENYENALKISQTIKSQRLIGIVYNSLGDLYEQKRNFKKSLEYYKKAEQIFRENNLKENLILTLTGIGKTYRKMGNDNKALAGYLEALELGKELRKKDGIAMAYLNIGELYLATGNHQRAVDYFQQSLDLAKLLQAKKLIRDNYQKMADAHEKLNNGVQAYNFYKLFKIYNDSLYNQTQLTLLSEMQARFNVEGKDRENRLQKQLIEVLNEQKQTQSLDIQNKERLLRFRNLALLGILGLAAMAIAFLIVMYQGRIKSQKINKQLQAQNEEINRQKAELEKKSDQLIQTYLKITDSIRYAETIQKSILPSEGKMKEILKEYFVISKAKEVVSGDFYWVSKVKAFDSSDFIFVAVVDCTGHGVSGGFMTMIGHTLLNEIINQGIYSPALVLEMLNQGLANIIQRQNQEISIGMEVGLCRIESMFNDATKIKLTYAGAKRPLLSIKPNGSLPTEDMLELRGDREPIGFASIMQRSYQNQEIIVEKGSLIYLTSDGYADQADPNNKRIGSPKLKKALMENADKDLNEQKNYLENLLREHQKNALQRDDITIMGIKV